MNEAKKARLAELEAQQRELERPERELRAELFFRYQLPEWRATVNNWRANMPDRAKHPVWYHLAEAYLRRLEGVIHATDHSIPNALPENIWKELGQLAELMGMSVKRTQQVNLRIAEDLNKAGFPWNQLETLLRIPNKRGPARGARRGINPPMNAQQLIEAAEMSQVQPRKEYREIADHFCPPECPDRRSGHHVCKENVRDRVEKLRKALDGMPIL